MNIQQGNATFLAPEVLLRFMLYTNTTRKSTTQLAPDAWVDFDTAFGPTFQAGTEHQISVVNPNRKAISYKVVVADSPVLGQVPHPNNADAMVPVATLYLMPATASCYPILVTTQLV